MLRWVGRWEVGTCHEERIRRNPAPNFWISWKAQGGVSVSESRLRWGMENGEMEDEWWMQLFVGWRRLTWLRGDGHASSFHVPPSLCIYFPIPMYSRGSGYRGRGEAECWREGQDNESRSSRLTGLLSPRTPLLTSISLMTMTVTVTTHFLKPKHKKFREAAPIKSGACHLPYQIKMNLHQVLEMECFFRISPIDMKTFTRNNGAKTEPVCFQSRISSFTASQLRKLLFSCQN
jgi:hypothetical protein